ncbi:MAG: Mut7-C RNAse domain-containing protein [Candidatus Aminicenantes bacterium]|nr:Mut7-C RNAse domain-containing protein [Candidatus Aminicenantes bacterium]
MILPPRFACDVMLGSMAKWLRMLGIDTFYDNQAADADLKRLCLEEKRILLTKDRALHDSMPVGTSRLVGAVHLRAQLEEIVRVFRLDRFDLPPRCSACNGELETISKEQAKDRVPPYVFLTQERFQRCAQCRKLYWPGTHLKRIAERIVKIRKACE